MRKQESCLKRGRIVTGTPRSRLTAPITVSMSYLPMRRVRANVLFQALADERSERGSLVLTCQQIWRQDSSLMKDGVRSVAHLPERNQQRRDRERSIWGNALGERDSGYLLANASGDRVSAES